MSFLPILSRGWNSSKIIARIIEYIFGKLLVKSASTEAGPGKGYEVSDQQLVMVILRTKSTTNTEKLALNV